MELLSFERFASLVGEIFEVGEADVTTSLTLENASALGWSASRNGQAFKLEWCGPVGETLPQATYAFRHQEDRFEIFIVPIAEVEGSVRYEAIFN